MNSKILGSRVIERRKKQEQQPGGGRRNRSGGHPQYTKQQLSWYYLLFISLALASCGPVYSALRLLRPASSMNGEQQQQQQEQFAFAPSFLFNNNSNSNSNNTNKNKNTNTNKNGSNTVAAPRRAKTEAPKASTLEKRKHAIIVPYRDRPYHYQVFRQYVETYLKDNFDLAQQEFSLWVIEQHDDEPFNRAWLTNVGLAEIFKAEPTTECITLHDIDLIPDNSTRVKGPAWYDKCNRPTQIGSELERWNWTMPYHKSAGGITTLSVTHWKKLNGMSNDYVGWGGEGDDFYRRMFKTKLLDGSGAMKRPPRGHGRFRAISQNKSQTGRQLDAHFDITMQLYHQMQGLGRGSQRWKYDGLSDLQYTVESADKQPAGGFHHIHHLKVRQQLLEFVHIPKTAGSSIEQAAALANIPWGACHFHHSSSIQMKCPDPPNFAHLGLQAKSQRDFPLGNVSMWHIPPHMWNINLLYSKKTFAVVRNPYTMAVSLYYDKWVGYTGDAASKRRPATLNAFLTKWFARPPNPLFKLTQAKYVYKGDNVVIDHVLKFETLDAEFAALMKQYHLEDRIRLPPAGERTNEAVVGAGSKKLGVGDLSNTTLRLIEKHYARDFELFGYPKMTTA
jgi:hypothetical protein